MYAQVQHAFASQHGQETKTSQICPNLVLPVTKLDAMPKEIIKFIKCLRRF
uniref:Uncharacterized protein n=1 Tax=Rhizophora mucronata TaxID=61149 RepID=A0A2P2PCD5_RHIMU